MHDLYVETKLIAVPLGSVVDDISLYGIGIQHYPVWEVEVHGYTGVRELRERTSLQVRLLQTGDV